MIRYDAAVIREFAQHLYNQANLIVPIYTVVGVIVGATLGSFFEVWAALLGALIIGGIAYLIGQSRSFQLRLEAQVALCQVQIEENTAKFLSEGTRVTAPEKVETVAAREKRKCPNCGVTIYSTTTRCPECSTELT